MRRMFGLPEVSKKFLPVNPSRQSCFAPPFCWRSAPGFALVFPWRHRERKPMAKVQAKSNKETRKPKAEKPKKPNASNPSTK